MISRRIKLVVNLFILIASCNLHLSFASEDSYYNQRAQGWHWYNDPKAIKEDEKEAEDEENDPVVKMDAIRATVKRALDQAVLNPTKENVKNYKVKQDQIARQSDKFSNVWKEVLLENPELDYSLLFPTNNTGRMIESDETHAKEDAAIKNLAKSYGLFFFYHSTCPYCRAFAPILKQFADAYGIHVTAITTDGIALPEFPKSFINNGQTHFFGVKVEPALFAVNPYNGKKFPITYGLISLADLKTRVLEIATRFGEENK